MYTLRSSAIYLFFSHNFIPKYSTEFKRNHGVRHMYRQQGFIAFDIYNYLTGRQVLGEMGSWIGVMVGESFVPRTKRWMTSMDF